MTTWRYWLTKDWWEALFWWSGWPDGQTLEEYLSTADQPLPREKVDRWLAKLAQFGLVEYLKDNQPKGCDPLVEGHNPLVEGHNPLVEGHNPLVEGHNPLVEGHNPLVEDHNPLVEPVTLFNWTTLAKHPHLLLLGETGSGKSTLARAILGYLPGQVCVIDPHAQPQTWSEFEVVGAGRNYSAIADRMAAFIEELDKRYALYSKGEVVFEPLNLVVDEYPSIAASDPCSRVAQNWLKTLGREARKVAIRLIVLSQGAEVKTLGLEGEGSLRECFTVVRLGKFALQHSKSCATEVQQWLQTQSHPILVGDCPAKIPGSQSLSHNPDRSSFISRLATSSDQQVEGSTVSDCDPCTATTSAPTATSRSEEIWLYNAVQALLESGKSRTWVIEHVFGHKGRNFEAGKAKLDSLILRYSSHDRTRPTLGGNLSSD